MRIRALITPLVLFVFWLLLSGHSDRLLLSLGILSCLFVAWLSHKLALFDPNSRTLRFNLNLPRFLPWFFLEVIKSNLEVSRRILHPKLPIDPHISTLPISRHGDVAKAVYANCITLTPGTYSLDISAESIEVHSLTKELADNLRRGKMSQRILALEANSAKSANID